jgi:hypothetical protein
MYYKTHSQDDTIDTNGTFLQGKINLPYSKLEKVLGAPMRFQDDKVRVEWDIVFNDGLVATIYDWKEYSRAPHEVTDWHIGGRDYDVVSRVYTILRGI